MIDINKKYRYRNGEPARILCTDGFNKKRPIISMKQDGYAVHHYANGYVFSEKDDYDLFEITLKVDDPVIVWNVSSRKHNRHFKEFNEYGDIVCFSNGQTSFSCVDGDVDWKFWELPNE